MLRNLWRAGRLAARAIRPAGTGGRELPIRTLAACSNSAVDGGGYRLFIDGAFVAAEADATIKVVSPADNTSIATIADASVGDVNAAVEAARRTFDDRQGAWRQTTAVGRAAMLSSMACQLQDRLEEFATLESKDCGKPIVESRADMEFCIAILRYYAGIVERKLQPEVLETDDPDFRAKIVKEPIGVIGCITPWNYPLMQSVNKVAPAIAAGCTVVIKPSPLASITTVMLGELAAKAGVPAGVLNIVTGGPPTGSPASSVALAEHPLLDKLSFTGSSATGEKLLHASAAKLRPTSLELGGKGAIVVFEDANVSTAVDWIMVGIFLCTGQVCSATSRLLIHEAIADEVLAELKVRTEKIVLGNPLSEDTVMGPLVSKSQQENVLRCIYGGIADGCHVLTGGTAPPVLAGDFTAGAAGSYVQPTIFTDVPVTSAVWTEEIFGPVLATKTFTTEEEAIAMANASPYGLAHAVLSNDQARCSRVAALLEAGVVYENCSQVGFVTTPFGGCKQSGFGREWGEVGLEEYVHHKTVTSATSSKITWKWYGG